MQIVVRSKKLGDDVVSVYANIYEQTLIRFISTLVKTSSSLLPCYDHRQKVPVFSITCEQRNISIGVKQAFLTMAACTTDSVLINTVLKVVSIKFWIIKVFQD